MSFYSGTFPHKIFLILKILSWGFLGSWMPNLLILLDSNFDKRYQIMSIAWIADQIMWIADSKCCSVWFLNFKTVDPRSRVQVLLKFIGSRGNSVYKDFLGCFQNLFCLHRESEIFSCKHPILELKSANKKNSRSR